MLLGVYGIANQYPSRETGATEDDVDKVAEGLWQGTLNLITRSKVGHIPRLLLEVIYREGFSGAAGALDEKIKLFSPDAKELSEDEQLAIRSPKDCQLDIAGVCQRLRELAENIETVNLWTDSELKVEGIEDLRRLLGNKLIQQKR